MTDGQDVPSDRYQLIRALVIANVGLDGSVDGSGGVVPALRGLCTSVVTHLSVVGAAVTLTSLDDRDGSSAGVAAASSGTSAVLAEQEDVVGEGPRCDALVEHRPVLVADLASQVRRWPAYTSLAVPAGVAAVFVFPLEVGGVGLGVLQIFAGKAGSLGNDGLADALTFADVATDILLDGTLVTVAGDLESGLSSALSYRSEIYQAQGMLMVALDVSATEALLRMRAYAFAHGRSLIEVAQQVHDGDRLEEHPG